MAAFSTTAAHRARLALSTSAYAPAPAAREGGLAVPQARYLGRRLAGMVGKAERVLWDRSPVILMYHRVAACADDPWGIAVDPVRFDEQMAALKRVRQVVPLDEVLAWQGHGRRGARPLAAITFDDGYHDALTQALPILERHDCPATVFVVSGLVGSGRGFWWDELVRVLMSAPAGGAPLSLTTGGRTSTWRAPDHLQGRRRLCRQVRRRLRNLDPGEIDRQLDAICAWAGLSRWLDPGDRLLTGEEVARLSGSLVGIGAHTVRHPSLPALAPEAQLREMAESRSACEAWTGRPVEHFAYPFGHYDRSSLAAARAAGFRSACATTPGVVRPWSDPLRLARISPGRMDGEALGKLLS